MNNASNSRAIENVRIKHVLDKHPMIRLAILFGSVAKGEARRDSDLDLAVDVDRPLEEHERIQLIAELAEVSGRPVDVVDLFSAGEPLLGQIMTGGRKILGDNTRYAFMVSKHLFNQADFMPYRSRILQERRRAWIGLSENDGSPVNGCFLFAAVHMGPYQSLAPLENAFDGIAVRFIVNGPARDARRSAAGEYWDLRRIEATYGTLDRFLEREAIRAVIVGTSDGVPDGNVEELAVRAATAAGITVFVIEDFPGNYRHRADSRLDGLFVEDDLLRGVHSVRGVPLDRIYCTGNPRYDVLRTLDRERLRAAARASLGIGAERVVLWAGQPDGDNSYLALERLMPHVSREGVALLFKAHPRDTAYHSGRYGRMLSGAASIKDVTQEKNTIGLCCAADLVITQFSSVGVEAGYLGTPVLYTLFDDLGKAYVRQHKGYDCVPWATRECAFALDSSNDLRGIIGSALFDEAARSRVRENFRRCYLEKPPGAEAVAAVIRQRLSGSVE